MRATMKVRPKGKKQSIKLMLEDTGSRAKCTGIVSRLRSQGLVARMKQIGKNEWAVYAEVKAPAGRN